MTRLRPTLAFTLLSATAVVTTHAATDAVAQPAPGVREVEVIVDAAYAPNRIEAHAGGHLRLRFVRQGYSGCTREVVFPSLDIHRTLPTNVPVVIDLPALPPGGIDFHCGMNMVHGTIVVLSAADGAHDADAHTAGAPLDEHAAYEAARPAFVTYCASCHASSGREHTRTAMLHFAMDRYPFGGHHARTIGPTVREVLGASGHPATMPDDHPGAVQGDDLARILAWADAWDRAHPGGTARPGSPAARTHSPAGTTTR